MAVTKPYELTFVKRDLYVYAHIKADEITREIGVAYLSEIVDACHKYKKNKLMIYRDIPEMLSPEQRKELSSDFLTMIGNIRTAAVNPYLEKEQIVESMASDHANIKVFTNFAEAEAWLLS